MSSVDADILAELRRAEHAAERAIANATRAQRALSGAENRYAELSAAVLTLTSAVWRANPDEPPAEPIQQAALSLDLLVAQHTTERTTS